MKKLFLFFCLTLLSHIGYAQSLEIAKKVHNFGTILEKDGEVEYIFTVKNTSKKPFIINFISTGCGCTGVKYDKSPIMPQQEREMTLSYDPTNRAGLFRTAVNIVGASPREDYTFHVVGNIVPRQKTANDLYPFKVGLLRIKEEMINYGIMPTGENHIYFIEVYNPTDKEIGLRVEKSNKSDYCKTWVTKPIVKPNSTSNIMYELSLKNSDYLGDIDDKITIYIDNVAQTNKIKVAATLIPNVYGLTSQEMDDAPVAIFDKRSHVIADINQTNNSYDFVVENTGGGELKILKAIIRNKVVEVKQDFEALRENEKGRITLTLLLDKFDKRTNGRVTLITSSPHTPIITLTLVGNKI